MNSGALESHLIIWGWEAIWPNSAVHTFRSLNLFNGIRSFIHFTLFKGI
jgi:hypothetical protein